MIISDEQVRLCVEYLQTTSTQNSDGTPPIKPDVPSDLIERVRTALASAPDTRAERVQQAREMLSAGAPSTREIVDKMVGRIVSDSLR